MLKQIFVSFILIVSTFVGLEAGALREKGPEYSQFSQQFKMFTDVKQSRKAGRTIIESGQKLPQPLKLTNYSHPGSACVSPKTCFDHACPANGVKPCCTKKYDKAKTYDKAKAWPTNGTKPCCVKPAMSSDPKKEKPSTFNAKMNTVKEKTQTFFKSVGKFFKAEG